MYDFSYLVLDIFSVIILILLRFWFGKSRGDEFLSGQHLFKDMIMINIIILLLDALTWYFDGNIQPFAVIANRIVTCCFYITNPLMSFFYVLYCDRKLSIPLGKQRKKFWIYCIPLLLHTALAFISAFTPIIYELDAKNVYHRGPLFFFSFVVSYGYLLYAFLNVIKTSTNPNRKIKNPEIYRSLLFYPLPPIIGSILQTVFSEVSIIWCSTVISLLIIFVHIQNRQITTDALTGLYNRSQILPYLDWKSGKVRNTFGLYIILIDLDDFKQINDKYGHIVGDRALVNASEIIKTNCDADDFIGRYGGDEFVIITEKSSEKSVLELIRKIDAGFAAFNKSKKEQYPLSASIGYSVWTDDYSNSDAFISAADSQMYKRKAEKKKHQL